MTKNALLLGLTSAVVEDAQWQLELEDIELFAGTGIEDVRRALAERRIDHVIIGAGLDLTRRLEIVREVFERSDTARVHMKDRLTGPDGFVPFAYAVLIGLDGFRTAKKPHI